MKMSTIAAVVRFVDDSSILSGIFSGLLVSALVAAFVIYILRWPSFRLILDLQMKTGTNAGVLDFDLENKKRFMSYDADEVYVFLYIPVTTISQRTQHGEMRVTKKFFLITKNGHVEWDALPNIRDKEFHHIEGNDYFLVRQTVKLDVFPKRKAHFLRIVGDFDRKAMPRVYYWFSTRHGIYPRFVKLRWWPFFKPHTGKYADVLAGRLPSTLAKLREFTEPHSRPKSISGQS